MYLGYLTAVEKELHITTTTNNNKKNKESNNNNNDNINNKYNNNNIINNNNIVKLNKLDKTYERLQSQGQGHVQNGLPW